MQRSIALPRARSVALLLACTVAVQTFLAEPGRAGSGTVRQPPRARQILVVAANLEEAWDARDTGEASDLAAFVRRLDALAPHAPDVLLLQEVTRAGGEKLVELLKAETGRSFAVAAAAGRSPADVKKKKVISRETAILINVSTMKRVGPRRYIDTSFAKRHGAGGSLREVKRNAVALVREKRTGLTYPVASVHFHTRRQIRTAELSRRYRKVWSRRVDAFITKEYPRYRHNAVIGGDFNAERYRQKKGRRFVQRWWRAMTTRRLRDAIYEVAPFGGVDYIFTRTRIAGAGVDRKYDRSAAAGTDSYYSDHRLRWALLGRWRPSVRARPLSSTLVKVAWDALPSAKKYVIQRRGGGSKGWRRVTKAGGRTIATSDLRLEPRTRYRYRVFAWNGAERSDASRVISVRTKRDSLAPRRPRAPLIRPVVDPPALKLKWRRAPDRGGSGGVHYEVWRHEVAKDAERVAKTSNPRFVDRNFSKRLTREYFIVAVDAVGNRSRRSPAATFVPALEATTRRLGL